MKPTQNYNTQIHWHKKRTVSTIFEWVNCAHIQKILLVLLAVFRKQFTLRKMNRNCSADTLKSLNEWILQKLHSKNFFENLKIISCTNTSTTRTKTSLLRLVVSRHLFCFHHFLFSLLNRCVTGFTWIKHFNLFTSMNRCTHFRSIFIHINHSFFRHSFRRFLIVGTITKNYVFNRRETGLLYHSAHIFYTSVF